MKNIWIKWLLIITIILISLPGYCQIGIIPKKLKGFLDKDYIEVMNKATENNFLHKKNILYEDKTSYQIFVNNFDEENQLGVYFNEKSISYKYMVMWPEDAKQTLIDLMDRSSMRRTDKVWINKEDNLIIELIEEKNIIGLLFTKLNK